MHILLVIPRHGRGKTCPHRACCSLQIMPGYHLVYLCPALDKAYQTGGLVMINHAPTPDAPPLSPDDMLALFVGEVDEDMATIQRTLQQLEPDDQLDTARLQTLQRTAHKMKGTSGAIGYTAMAS